MQLQKGSGGGTEAERVELSAIASGLGICQSVEVIMRYY